MAAIDGNPKTGWASGHVQRGAQPVAGAAVRAAADHGGRIDHHRPDPAGFGMRRATIGRFRLALSSASYPGPARARAAAKAGSRRGRHRRDCEALRVAPEDRRMTTGRRSRCGTCGRSRKRTELVADVARLEGRASLLDWEIPRVVVSEATSPTRHAHSGARQLDGRIGRRRAAGIPGFLGKLETGGAARDEAGSGELAGLDGESADRAGIRESGVAAVLRHRNFEVARRPRVAGRMADASGAARLARGGIRGPRIASGRHARMGREASDPHHRHRARRTGSLR